MNQYIHVMEIFFILIHINKASRQEWSLAPWIINMREPEPAE